MPEDNIKAIIDGLEQNVDLPDRYLVSAAVAGAALTVDLNKGGNTTGEWQLEPDETPSPLDVVIDNPNQDNSIYFSLISSILSLYIPSPQIEKLGEYR